MMYNTKVTEETRKHLDWLFDKNNEFNCSECEYNTHSWNTNLPCGNGCCWVTLHCKEEEEVE